MVHDDDMPPADETELREAAALARALEDGSAHPDLPEDAWQVAMLLRHMHHAQPDTTLPAALEKALDDEARRRKRRRLRTLGASFGAALALAALLLLTVGRAPGATRFPPPSLALLEAQARAATTHGAAAELEAEMRTYRRELYAALDARYRGAP